MDLSRILRVLWSHRWLLLAGAVFGLVLSFLSVYRIGTDKSGTWVYEPRSYTTYRTTARVILERPGFELGRALTMKEAYSYPDPERTINLAVTYAYMMTSDFVERDVRREVGPVKAKIEAQPVESAPIIELTVEGRDSRHIKRVAQAVVDSFARYLKKRQDTSGVPVNDRVLVAKLEGPTPPAPQRSRTTEVALLAFLAPVAAFGGAALVFENVQQKGKIPG